MASINILKYDDFKTVLGELKSKNKLDNNSLLTFVMYRYISKLGYDLYDLDVSTVDFERYSVDISANTGSEEPIHFIFSLLPNKEKYTSNEVVGYIYFDPSVNKLSLYFKVFEKWNLIGEVLFSDEIANDEESANEQRENMQTLNEFILSKNFNQNYSTFGGKFFTGTVVDSMFVAGDLDNEFVRKSLIAELNDPSDGLMRSLAKLLMDYSLKDEDWLYEQIKPLQATGELMEVLNSAIKKSELKVSTPAFATPTPFASKKRSPYAGLENIENNIEDKKNDLLSAGFEFDDTGDTHTTVVDVAHEEVEDYQEDTATEKGSSNPFAFGSDDDNEGPINLGDLFKT